MNNLQCIICMELYKSQDEIIVTPCGHLFHKLCLTNWFRHQPNCAQCRQACTVLNLIRVYLNTASDTEVHLARNCNVERISEELELSKINLQTLQHDLKNSDSTIMELKTVIASFEDLKLKNIHNKELENELELINIQFQTSEEDLKKARKDIAELKLISLSTDKKVAAETSSTVISGDNACENISKLETELKLVKLQKKILEDELKAAEEEIAQMKCVTQALALQNLSRYNFDEKVKPAKSDVNIRRSATDRAREPRSYNEKIKPGKYDFDEKFKPGISDVNINRRSATGRPREPRSYNENIKPEKYDVNIKQNSSEHNRNNNSENINNLSNQRQHNNHRRQRNRFHNKNNLKEDGRKPENHNFNRPKPKITENEPSDPNMANMDEPWW